MLDSCSMQDLGSFVQRDWHPTSLLSDVAVAPLFQKIHKDKILFTVIRAVDHVSPSCESIGFSLKRAGYVRVRGFPYMHPMKCDEEWMCCHHCATCVEVWREREKLYDSPCNPASSRPHDATCIRPSSGYQMNDRIS